MATAQSILDGAIPVPCIGPEDVALFESAYRAPGRPVIIKGGASHWPAMTKWSFEWLREKYGSVSIPVLVGDRMDRDMRNMYMADFIEKIIDPLCSPPLYLRLFPFRLFLRDLQDDLAPVPYCPADRRCIMNLWLGSAKTITPFHKDNYDPLLVSENILSQIIGRKRAYLVSPKYDDCMYGRADAGVDNHFSEVDIDNIDLIKYPKFSNVELMVADLNPGDMLYIPRDTWHHVFALDPSLSVSTLWKPFYILDIFQRFSVGESVFSIVNDRKGTITTDHIKEFGGAAELRKRLYNDKRDLRPYFLEMFDDGARALMRETVAESHQADQGRRIRAVRVASNRSRRPR